MELSIARKDLLRFASRMLGVTERKSTMPMASNVLLHATGGQLRFAATDLNISIMGRVQADIVREGSVAVAAKDLVERIRMMPEGPVLLASQDNAMVTLRSHAGARRYTVRGIRGEDFPKLPEPAEGSPSLTLDVASLKELIDKTHFSISPEETRAHLNSALFEWDGDTVRMVTTDGHRLSKLDLPSSGRQAKATMIIPQKGIMELRKLCEDVLSEGRDAASSLVQMTQSGPTAFFQGSGVLLGIKLVDATFPPYNQVIPQSSDRVARAPRQKLAEALRAVSVAASDKTGGVKLSFFPETLRISTESPDAGEAFDEVPLEYAGPPVTMGFNAKYFLDVLGALQDEEDILLQFTRELDPTVIRPASDKRYLAVIMPMRI